MKTYTSYQNDIPRIINNSLTDNLTWGTQILNESLRYLITKYYFNERSYTTTTVSGQQFYNLPPQIKKMINMTINVGNVLWQPTEVTSRSYWDYLNTIQFSNTFPSKFFIYNGQVGIWPTPASSGNVITINYKIRTIDISMPDITDVTTGNTMGVTNGTTTITATSAGTTNTFSNWMSQSGWVRIPHSTINATNGDNQWYQISSVTSGTQAVLANPYAGSTASGCAFVVGDVTILPEDYQDLPEFRLGIEYYTTRFPDKAKVSFYQKLYDDGSAKLDEEFGSKTTSIVLADGTQPMINPNLFQTGISGH